ncbi:hypothetical protein IC575_024706 [Cucumis melo]
MLYLMEVMQFFLGLRHRGLRPVETVSTVSRICAENWGSINLVTASEKSLACSSATKAFLVFHADMLIYLENLCCCCSNLVGAVEDLGQSSLEHILDNFDVDNRNCLSSWTVFSCFTEGKVG